MEPKFLPNNLSFQEKSRGVGLRAPQSMAMAFASRVKHRITELETIIERTRKIIQSRKRLSQSDTPGQ